MGKAQLEQLEKHGVYLSVPKGISMWPMIHNKQDVIEIHKLDHPAKRYDLVMYTRGKEQQGVVHRVLHVREKEYVIAGDNCWQLEYIPHEKVAGIATRFCRKRKWYDVNNKGYLFYVHLWTDFFFIRCPILFIRDQCKRVVRKIKKTFISKHPN